jgi:hypothetical protein
MENERGLVNARLDLIDDHSLYFDDFRLHEEGHLSFLIRHLRTVVLDRNSGLGQS